jgi:hypothetical protein
MEKETALKMSRPVCRRLDHDNDHQTLFALEFGAGMIVFSATLLAGNSTADNSKDPS